MISDEFYEHWYIYHLLTNHIYISSSDQNTLMQNYETSFQCFSVALVTFYSSHIE